MEDISVIQERVWATLDRIGERLDRMTEKQKETDHIVKYLAKEVGGIPINNALIAEAYFFNTLSSNRQAKR
jgi:hypothetical protein